MTRRLASLALFLIAGLTLAPAAICAENTPALASPTAPGEPDAKALLLRMADFLGKTQAFSVNIDAVYDVMQASGQKIEFGEVRRVLIDRPDRLRVQSEMSNGEKLTMYFDGKTFTMFSPRENVFTKVEKPGSVDSVIKFIVQDLQTPIPLSMLLLASVKDELEKRATEVDFVERTSIAGKPADHLAARTDGVDFQVWVAQGARPLPLRVVITYDFAEGQPQFSADLNDWNFAPKIEESAFAFSPPAGAQAIPLMVALPNVAAAKRREQ
jgi:hypothetical protein